MNQFNQNDLGESNRVSREERGWTQRFLVEKSGEIVTIKGGKRNEAIK
ncbi:hypothetical protein ABXM49_06470 [Enterococcus faecium]